LTRFPAAAAEILPSRLSVASYNIHSCFGIDGRYSPERTAEVIRELQPDIIGLQEVDSRLAAERMLQLDYLAARTRLKAVAGPCIRDKKGCYGNALLTKFPVVGVRLIDLSIPGREPRGAMDVDLNVNGALLRTVVTHLGCSAVERRHQIRRLLDRIDRRMERPALIMGDFNEWIPMSNSLKTIHSRVGAASSCRTFPSRFPVFALDRIWVCGNGARPEFSVHKTPLSRTASDHLPITASILF